jgi:hypothetical protein
MNQHESLGESLRHLAGDLGDLFRAELALFKRETVTQVRGLAAAGIWMAGAAVMGLAFLGAFTALLIIALGLALPLWAAALIVTMFWGIGAAGLLAAAVVKFREATPIDFDQTARSVKEDITWIKSGMSPAK